MVTRWIDDIVFSGTIKDVKRATSTLIGLIKHSGFVINKRKTLFILRKLKPVIVGLDVKRNKPHIPELQILEVERLTDKCITDGPVVIQSTYNPNGGGKIKDLQQSLAGKTQIS